jgi:hypothetical protein
MLCTGCKTGANGGYKPVLIPLFLLATVRDSDTSEISHMSYEHAPESGYEEVSFPNKDSSCGDDSVDQDKETPSLDGCGEPSDNDECSTEQDDSSEGGDLSDDEHDGRASEDEWLHWYRR